MTQLTNDIYAIEAPEGATQIEVLPDECDDTAIAYKGSRPQPENQYDILHVLPGLNWQLIGTTKVATKEQAIEAVGSSDWFFPVRHKRYIDYAHPYKEDNKQAWGIGFGDPLESLRSLLVAKNLDPNRNYVLIKKQ